MFFRQSTYNPEPDGKPQFSQLVSTQTRTGPGLRLLVLHWPSFLS